MTTKIASNVPLSEMIKNALKESREKLSAAMPDSEKKEDKKESKKDEKKEGKDPEKDEKKNPFEKASSSSDVESVIEALEFVSEKLAAGAYLGEESKQGGQTLATNSAVGGEQAKNKDGSKKNKIPLHGGTTSDPSQGPTKTQVMNDADHVPGGTGTQKTANFAEHVAPAVALGLAGAVGHHNGKEQKKRGEKYNFGVPQALASTLLAPAGAVYQLGRYAGHQTKKSSAVESILSKIAEATQGGMQLSSASGQGPKPPSDSKGGNEARKALESNEAATNMKKIDGKAPQKKMMAPLLKEPSQTKSTDSKLQDNLRNTSKAGVKIAEARRDLVKIAAEGCSCDGKGDCKYCKLQAALKSKKS